MSGFDPGRENGDRFRMIEKGTKFGLEGVNLTDD